MEHKLLSSVLRQDRRSFLKSQVVLGLGAITSGMVIH